MKLLKLASGLVLIAAMLAPSLAPAAEKEKDKDKKPKPYPMDTCVVSGEKLGEMGKPYVHEYKGREIKFCCKDCLKDFNKDPDKYIKKIEEAEAKKK